jgi:membrane protease YdiL (CAAX protease family)
MKSLKSFAAHHPVLFAVSLTVAWFVFLMLVTGMASGALRRPFGDGVTGTIGRLVTTACVLLLIWRIGWLGPAGITRAGGWQVWLLALAGLLYYAAAGLYSFYGQAAFDFSNLIRSPASHVTVLTQFFVSLCEEILFRGIVLYGLVRAWGETKRGLVGSVGLSALLFAGLHLTQVFSSGVSLSSALLLALQVWVISVWWGALVLWGGSLWPAVALHFAGNALLAVQGLVTPMLAPEVLVYRNLLAFSLVPGILGLGLLACSVHWKTAVESP